MIRVLKSNPTPLYIQVANELRSRIRNGHLALRERLPSLESLANEFGIARVTARQAISLLEGDGLIWRKQGKGTFVSSGIKEQRWLKLHTEWSAIVNMTLGTSIKLLELSNVGNVPNLSTDLGRPARRYKLMKRVHSKEGSPYGIIDIYLDKRVYDKDPQLFLENQVISVLEKVPDLKVKSGLQILTIGTADMMAAEHLGIEIGSPVAHVRRILSDQSNIIVYVGDVIYRGDYVKLEINLIK